MKPAFVISFALLALGTGAIVFDLSREPDVTASLARRPRRPPAADTAADTATDTLRPTIPITLDGVSLHPEAPPQAGSVRLVARTIGINLTTDRFHDVRDAIDKWVAARHGSLVGVQASPSRILMVTVTVPPAEAQAARAGVSSLGTVLREVPSSEDLTDSHRALLMRVLSARAEDQRLTALLAGDTSKIPDLAGVKRAQARAHVDAERLDSEAAALSARAAVVTFELKIEGRQPIGPASSPDGP